MQDNVFENVKDFVYLRSVFTFDNDCSKDIRARIAKAKGVFAEFNNIWKSKQVRYNRKLKLFRSCVFSVALYASET